VLLTVGALTLVSLALLPAGGPHRVSAAADIVFADQPVPSDQQLLLRAAADARRSAIAARQPQPTSIQGVITAAFAPLGDAAVGWAIQIAFCESTDNPNAVNASSDAQGLFQFLPSTWRGTPYAASSPFDPIANAQAAAWLLQKYGPSQWECQA
jgi:hypothetical protein